MAAVQASCPACGAAIEFKIGTSRVAVCAFCRSVVARGDRKLEDLGKVADLVDTNSPLEVGMKGRFEGVPFELTGRAQLGHAAGGMWDEWYAACADGRWGWLAEAQGRFYFTFPQKSLSDDRLPPFAELEPGRKVMAVPGQAPLVVAETGQATMLAAQGEIPYRLIPNEVYEFADLAGKEQVFATLDYSESPPLVFVGREVSLDDLGVPKKARARDARQVEGVQLSCPQCGGPLALRAPDKTERVACPNCGALLDVNQGQLAFLKSLTPGKVAPVLPLGTVGMLAGTPLTVIGFMQRSVEVEAVEYFWEEYLLYEPRVGFRWLVRSDDHWSYVEPVSPGEVSVRSRVAHYRDKHFKIFQKNDAGVTHVAGEFYWKVEVGECVEATDFVSPPEMLSREATAQEMNWSLGTYLTPAAVESAFGVKDLPQPTSVAPNQPFPYSGIYAHWAILSLAAVILGLIFLNVVSSRKLFERSFYLEPVAGSEQTQTFFSDGPLEIKARRNIRVTAESAVDNSWVFVAGELIDEDTGLVQSFELPVEYYHGVDGGESWSEGGRENWIYLSALPAGNYTLRVEVQRQHFQTPTTVAIRVDQGVPRILHLVFLLLVLAAIPVSVLIYHIVFESRRWSESSYKTSTEEE